MTSHFLLCLLIVVLSMRSADALHAGVLEFVPKVVTLPASREEAIAMMMVNAAKIAGTALAAKAKGIEILVLPEDCLTGDPFASRADVLPFAEPLPAPWGSGGDGAALLPFLQKTASSIGMALVWDMAELYEGGNATMSSDAPHVFNTQVAVGPDGTILGAYRKTHLFPEDLKVFDYPVAPFGGKPVLFDLGGLRVGMGVCFDIFFANPMAVESAEADLIVFSTFWENNGTTPLITAAQMQQAFSRKTNTTLLASNINSGPLGSGSGIWSTQDVARAQLDATNRLWSVNVPRATHNSLGGWPIAETFDTSSSPRTSKLLDGSVTPMASARSRVHVRHETETAVDSDGGIYLPPGMRWTTLDVVAGQQFDLSLSVSASTTCYASGTVGNASTTFARYALVGVDGVYFPTTMNATVCAWVACPMSPSGADDGGEQGACFSRFSLDAYASFTALDLAAVSTSPSSSPFFPVLGTDGGGILAPDVFTSSVFDPTTTMRLLDERMPSPRPLLRNAVLWRTN